MFSWFILHSRIPSLQPILGVLTSQMKAYRPNKNNEHWEQELIQQEPNNIDIFAYEEKNIKFIGQETDPAALW